MKLLRSFTITAALAAGMVHGSFAQQKTEWKDASSGGYSYKYVTNDPTQSRFYTLKNGLTVILSPSKKEPRVQTYIAVKAGSKTDPATNTGLAHYLEHLLFKGTDRYGSLDWSKEKPLLDQIDALYEKYNKTTDETQRKAIYKDIDRVSGEAAKFAIANEYDKMMGAMGAKGTNAFTSFEQTVYTEDVPSNAINKYLAVQSERFRAPVLRIFHTELEAVYEEKNRGLDNDGRKVFEKMFATIFPNNNYGKQTTIGTVEHLKNPSLIEIRKYFNTYYVPNNMGIVMSGDFNPDQVIAEIDKDFGYMQNKAIPVYKFDPEAPIAAPVTAEVTGPDPENIMLGFRFPGAATKDAQMVELVGNILTNGAAGLIDLNLIQKQKLLSASAYPYVLKDYSVLLLQGRPTEGQSLDEVRSLLLAELDNLKKGNFPDDLIPSIINNERKRIIEENENYSSRASNLMSNFTDETNWKDKVDYVNDLSKITKADIIAFANKYLGNNYVAVYKRQGEDKNIVKVDKPPITPVEVNREAQSDFLKKVNAMPENKIDPVWVDFKKDIQTAKSGPYEVLAVQNKDNALFRLYYQFETGSWSSKLLPIAADYLKYLGTKNKSAEQVSTDFYKLASSFNVSAGGENTTISLDGLQDNFDKAVAMLDDLLHNCQADADALNAYKGRLKKARLNKKQNKGAIMAGLRSYAMYGAQNPFNNELTDAELEALKAEDLVAVLHNLADYKHRILYYGPQTATQLAAGIQKVHPAPATFKDMPAARKFPQLDQNKSQVLFAHFDMVQAEVFWMRNADQYNSARQPVISMFNEYFGGGMGSIVFQTIRESKALAYSTYSAFATPSRKEYRNSVLAYVGTQADKFNEAVAGMNELLTTLPQSDKALSNAKEGLRKSLATERYSEDGILFYYLSSQRMGRDFDIRKSTYEATPKFTFADLKTFHDQEMSHKPFAYCIVASQDKLKEEDMKKLGEFKKLNLQEIFGY
ncbi:M16 family metallopeptidase [Taibaiella koreensis]|uniref:M16 family metallopeptidase n=1 Tax=Taibaiella koreensis TaxID=1268548 RepID=UPI000E59D7FA|nr:M16 family metallopeptidase [Taibaiella koreensis]